MSTPSRGPVTATARHRSPTAEEIARPVSTNRVDLVLGAVVLFGALVSAGLTAISGYYGSVDVAGLAVPYALVLGAAVALRRKWPATMLIVVAVAYFVAVTIGIPELYAGNVSLFIVFYTVGAHVPDRRRALVIRVVVMVAMAAWLTVTIVQAALSGLDAGTLGPSQVPAFVASQLAGLLINVLYFGGAYYFGERSHQQAQERAALEQRTAELEAEREVTAAQAVALDRVRIARELHDVVAHHVSLMGVQAGAARSILTRDPDKSRDLLTGVEESARTSLRELRQLLETLRTSGGDAPDTAPTTHGLATIPALVEEATEAGLPTTFTVIGEIDAEPSPLLQVNLYRIAQEALTNARRHAGPGATADVRLRFDPDAVELEIANTGRHGPVRTGLGHLGMRERAAVSGGTVEIGPRTRGGYLVRARLPLTFAADASAPTPPEATRA
ncbi:sensor histidine kinase [Microbacterium sp. LMI1-1-1.1]|uniref:sensor histidine kinase n=1 Tax=Microbacterium sp. LMI1-1-1.1 TaxID=3135223 RepID=UPI00346683E3